jgi:hypothetical protein
LELFIAGKLFAPRPASSLRCDGFEISVRAAGFGFRLKFSKSALRVDNKIWHREDKIALENVRRSETVGNLEPVVGLELNGPLQLL